MLLKESTLTHNKKSIVLRSLFVGEKWSWKVSGISHDALKELEKNNFKKLPRRFERHHPIPFKKTAEQLFGHNKFSKEEFYELIALNEEVHLITKEEHKSQKYHLYKIDMSLGLFENADIGWKYGKKEEEYLRNLSKMKS